MAALIARIRARFARGRLVECARCGERLPVRRAVIIHGEVQAHREGFSATVAEYHKRCAPT